MDMIPNAITWLLANWAGILGGITSIVGGFAVLARFTPNTSDDRVIQVLLDLVNFGGMNNGTAKNAGD